MHKRELRSLICSMLLGDGCIYQGKQDGTEIPRAFYCMNHSIQQQDYALWKAKLIDNICVKNNINKKCTYSKSKKFDKNYNKTHHGIYVKFHWSEYFRLLRLNCYIQLSNKKHLKNIEYLLSEINSDLHTAIWFMDDGNEKRKKRKSVRGELLGYDNPYYRLCVYSCTEGQCNLIIEWFKQNYKVEPKIKHESKNTRGDNCRVLYFSVAESKTLFLRLSPYFSQTDSMRKKFWLSFVRYLPCNMETPVSLQDDDIVQTTTQ